MDKNTKLCWFSLLVAIILIYVASLGLKYTVGVGLGLQLERVWIGAIYGGKSCEVSAHPQVAPNYLSMVAGPFSIQQPMLQFQLAKIRVLRYRHYLPADLNNLAVAKKVFGAASLLSLNYECVALRDLIEINQAYMQMQYLQRVMLQQKAGATPPLTPLSPAPISFPTVTSNENFKWIAHSGKNLPNNATAVTKNAYICQGQLQGNNYTGQYSKGICRLTYAGKAFSVKKFAILTNKKGTERWVASSQATKMKMNPIYGGFEQGAPMAICRVKIANMFHVGKVVNGTVCDIAIGNQEAPFHRFEILYSNL